MKARENEGSLYPPLHPPGSRVLVRVSGQELTSIDRALVALSSLIIVGSLAWVPLVYAWAWKRWKRIPKDQKRRRALYAALLLAIPAYGIVGPHRATRVGRWLDVRNWRLWKAWMRFIAFEVLADSPSSSFNIKNDKAILAISPHGIFPFALAMAALPAQAYDAFGYFRPVVATATSFFPFVNTLLRWVRSVDANRQEVDDALALGDRIGLAPGGIAEMFEGYPKPGTRPHEEYAIIRPRKGFIRMAIKHGVPVVPVYCFGATKMMKRVQLPAFFEWLSKALRISIVAFFGVWGLPIPFRQKLTYVVGNPIFPPTATSDMSRALFDEQVDAMHHKFCSALSDLFDRYKEHYGWHHKELKLV